VALGAQGGFACLVVRYVPRTRSTGSAFGGSSLDRGAGCRETLGNYVFTASWCCSVGATWTMELRSVDRAALGRPVEWICSGVPTQQPAPEHQTADLLRERDLLLFPVDPVQSPPRTRSRRLIGYVTRDPQVMRLALMLADTVDHTGHDSGDTGCEHPMLLAARWIQAGYSAEAAIRWITAGVRWPKAAQTALRTPCPPPG
jgi:hypothetical protein